MRRRKTINLQKKEVDITNNYIDYLHNRLDKKNAIISNLRERDYYFIKLINRKEIEKLQMKNNYEKDRQFSFFLFLFILILQIISYFL